MLADPNHNTGLAGPDHNTVSLTLSLCPSLRPDPTPNPNPSPNSTPTPNPNPSQGGEQVWALVEGCTRSAPPLLLGVPARLLAATPW